MEKRVNRLLLVAFLAVMCLTIFVGCYDEWYIGGGAHKARFVCVKSYDVVNFINDYVTATPAYTVELPENYQGLTEVSYVFASNLQQIYTPDDFQPDEAFILMEFNLDGEKVGVVLGYKVFGGVRSPIKKNDGDVLVLKEDAPFYNYDKVELLSDEEVDHGCGYTMTYMLCPDITIVLDGYEPFGLIKEIREIKENEPQKRYNEIFDAIYGEKTEHSSTSSFIAFIDNRSVSAEEKQAWQMQVIKDILANMKRYYWTAPTAE